MPRAVIIYCIMIAVIYELNETTDVFIKSFIVFMFVWPHLIYLINNNLPSSQEVEFRALNIDGFYLGFWIAQLSFALIPTISIAAVRMTADFSIGQARLLRRGVVALVVGAIVGGVYNGWNWEIESSFETNIIAIFILAIQLWNSTAMYGSSARVLIKSRKAIKQREQEIAHINQVSKTINSTLDLELIISEVAKGLREIFYFDVLSLLVIDKKTNTLYYADFFGEGLSQEECQQVKKIVYSLNESNSVVDCVLTNEIQYFPKIEDFVEFMSPNERLAHDIVGAKSYIFYPLAVLGEAVGTIHFANKKDYFTLQEKNILSIEKYVNHIATAIHNAKQSKELKEKQMEMEQLAQKLARYLSPQIYDSIFSGEKDAKIETHSRHLTVFFSDIVNFTKKTEQSEILQLTAWLNEYLDQMATAAIRYDGTLDKFIGDAVMVFFGDPHSYGERIDAIKCVLMAMEMRVIAKMAGIDVRIGINSGECIVGNFGSEQRMEYTIIGREVNLAARLETNSEPGKILISDKTYELVKDVIRCEPRGEIQVKGIDQKVMTYWALEYDRNNIGALVKEDPTSPKANQT